MRTQPILSKLKSELRRLDPENSPCYCRAICEEILIHEPECTIAKFHLAMSLSYVGLFTLAAKVYKNIIKDVPRNKQWSVFVGLGFTSKSLAPSDEAENYFRKACEVSPSIAAPFIFLANMLFEKERFSAAIEVLLKALRQSGEHSETLAILGNCNRAIGNYQQAQHYYMKAVLLDPDDSAVNDRLNDLRKLSEFRRQRAVSKPVS